MMKWITLLGITLLTAGCCCNGPDVVGYQQVGYAPVLAPVVAPVVAPAPIIQPVVLGVDYPGHVDVTTTTVDYY